MSASARRPEPTPADVAPADVAPADVAPADVAPADPVSAPRHTGAAATTSGAPQAGSARTDMALFDTAIGVCAISWRGDAVVGFRLPEADPATARTRLRRAGVTEAEPTEMIRTAVEGVRAHLAGALDDLRWIALDLTGVPDFHRKVYAVTRAIDPGHTLSYGQVAERVGLPGAAQAVGQALGRNPIALIIPCHRVLAADHALHGFSAPGGIGTKAHLLTIEQTPGFGEPTLF